ncbi:MULTISPECIES: TetR/AcrR family transcriptional regulator [unclassified Streptomyces]|uniref:TetR/AcrR family transcriptional regulator n=1 Tax=unclassified Streptomyces TaxID=2593676 RepID=UPI002E28976B|nr:TetR family transcriptional regulator [Streptomyces sp. NBC_00223]
MSTRNAAATKARLLQAATDEFATYGIAGARVDRIAAAAAANKNLIYMYFGSKEQLFEAVCETAIARLLEAVPLNASDLPGYAGALFDFNLAHPRLIRLARWHSLERPGTVVLPAAVEATAAKLSAIAEAQAAGTVDAGLPPHVLLSLLLSLTSTWTDGSPEPVPPDATATEIALRRHAVVLAAARLTRPPSAT